MTNTLTIRVIYCYSLVSDIQDDLGDITRFFSKKESSVESIHVVRRGYMPLYCFKSNVATISLRNTLCCMLSNNLTKLIITDLPRPMTIYLNWRLHY